METINLKSKDGKTISVNRSILTRSAVLQRKLEELNAADTNGDTLDVPEADGDCLRKIIKWMERQEGTYEGSEMDNGEVMIPNNQEQNMVPFVGNNVMGGAFDKEMFTSFPQICVLVAAANRLGVQDIIDAAVRFVVDWKQGKNLEDLREMMENGTTQIRGSHQAGDSNGMQR
uniref:Skp1_POZ domain-containing protein n=1 Tax=Anopheles funestus TaxID=62324 RepID=A0A182RSZ4_ANOFN